MRRFFAHLSSPGVFCERPAGWWLTLARWTTGAVFVAFGVGKFVDHRSETSSFQAYGLPSPGVFTSVIGGLELVGGILLVLGLGTRAVAAVLAGDMVGAIIVSGLLRNETVSLTLAPVLLVVMLALVALGPGRLSLDFALRAGRRRRVTNRWSSESDLAAHIDPEEPKYEHDARIPLFHRRAERSGRRRSRRNVTADR
jgi:putative oxidoreductase